MEDNTERGKKLKSLGKYLIQANIEALPSGYIETPDPFYEQGYGYPKRERGWSFHRWYVWLSADRTLIFEKKTEQAADHYCNCRHASFVRKIYEKLTDLNKLHKILPRECNYTCLDWAERFEFRVISDHDPEGHAVVSGKKEYRPYKPVSATDGGLEPDRAEQLSQSPCRWLGRGRNRD
ncbi:MAG: hypothetical protein ACT4NU_05645 [Chromatiales bacterium]